MVDDAQGGRRSSLVTLLFTDLVASTELLERLGDEDFERLRRIHFQLLREAVTASGGQEVKNLGDGLMVVFPSALDAIGCAVAMQQAVDLHNTEPDVAPISVRVGLHAGEPIIEEDDYFGTPVVVAKRLCDRAAGGQILVSDLVAALVGGRRQFSFRDVGAMELKGLGEPLATREVVWQGDLTALTSAVPGSVTASGGARRTWMLAGVGAAVVAALAVGGFVMRSGEDTEPDAPLAAGAGVTPNAPVAAAPGAPRTFAQGRDPEAPGFFLTDVVTLLRQPVELPLDLRAEEIITILAKTEQGAIAPFLELRGPDGAVLTFDVDAQGRGLPSIERWLVAESGRHVLRISPLADVGRGQVEVIARTEDTPPSAEQPDAFSTVVALGEARPEAAWMWDTGETGQLKVRMQPHPDDPMLPEVRLSDGEGEVITLSVAQMRGGDLIELPHGGEWMIEVLPGAEKAEGTVGMQVWIMGTERPEPERIR